MNLKLWQERFEEYLRLRQYSGRTIEGHLAELVPFFDFLAAEGVERLVDITREHLEGYQTLLFYWRTRGRRLTTQTQKARLGRIRCFLRFAAQERYLLVDPGRELELPKDEVRIPRVVLTEDEVIRLLEFPDPLVPIGLRDRAILELLYGTGIRNTELRELTADQVDLDSRVVNVLFGKGRKSRLLPLGDEAAYWLGRYLQVGRPQLVADLDEPRVFLSKCGKPLARANLAQIVRRTAARAGLSKRATPHVLRHSCAVHMLRRGAGIRHLQELLGHASTDTTQRYTRLEISDLQWVHRRYHPRGRQTL